MKTLFRHLLLLGALFGLLWQGVAYASPPCAEMQHAQTSASSDVPGEMDSMSDCMDAQKQSRQDEPPCKDMKAGCFAMAGCVPLVGLGPMSPAEGLDLVATAVHDISLSPVLSGRAEAPIPDPPNFLG